MDHRRRAAGTRRIMPGVLLLVVGVFIAIGAPVVWSVTHRDPALRPIDKGVAVQLAGEQPDAAPDANFSAPATQRPVTATVPGRASVTTSPHPTAPTRAQRSTSGPAPRITSESKRETTTVPTKTSRPAAGPTSARTATVEVGKPVRLRIPAIGINAPVAAVGVDAKGDMAVPEQVQQIGWYRFGAAPGASAGSVVMSGHVDSAQQGLGAFSRLGDLKSGDFITVSDAAGHQLRYRVVGREAFDKKTAPMAALFSRGGAPRLTLITCGGDFDSSILSYVDNIVVTAVPA